jgi:hypothetical protein
MWHPLYTFGNDANAPPAAPTGLRRYKRYGKGYVKRGHEVLVFESQELADQYVAGEKAQAAAPNRKARRVIKAVAPKPAEVVDVSYIETVPEVQQSIFAVQIHDDDFAEQERARLLVEAYYRIQEQNRIYTEKNARDIEALTALSEQFDNEVINKLNSIVQYLNQRWKH